MTMLEKIEMYKGKKAFIDNISKAFEAKPKGSSVESINYEVYHKEVIIDNEVCNHFVEYLIVNFFGGGKSVKYVSSNSNTANFRVLGTLIDGGYYEEVSDYEALLDFGFTPVDLTYKNRLDSLLEKPMKHISDVRACFNYCKDGNDVEKVIKMIPAVFGIFDVEFSEDGETFTIINEYDSDNGIWESEEAEYEFYAEEN